MITKMLGGALILGAIALGASPANADSGRPDPNPNPFGGLTDSSQETGPVRGPAVTSDLNQGIQLGLTAQRPAPASE